MVVLRWGEETHNWLDPETGRWWRGEYLPPDGIEEHFGVELWLRETCCGGNLLWARNRTHLDYIAAFIAGEMREKEARNTYRPLSHKLPARMKSRKHRNEVLRVTEGLRATLDD
jgi:hypothetical protein